MRRAFRNTRLRPRKANASAMHVKRMRNYSIWSLTFLINKRRFFVENEK